MTYPVTSTEFLGLSPSRELDLFEAAGDQRMIAHCVNRLPLNLFELVTFRNDLLNKQRDEPVRHVGIDVRMDAFSNELLPLVRYPVGVP